MNKYSKSMLTDMFIDRPGSEIIPSGTIQQPAECLDELLHICFSIMPQLSYWSMKNISSQPQLKKHYLGMITSTFVFMVEMLVDDPSEVVALFTEALHDMEKVIDTSVDGRADES